MTVVILAAGRSERMGVPKALLTLGDESFLARIVRTYLGQGVHPIVVASPENASAIQLELRDHALGDGVVVNYAINGDRMSSVCAGLAACKLDEYAFVQDVDRPFVTGDVIEALLDRRDDAAVVAPDVEGHAGHPVLLPPRIIRALLDGPRAPTLRDALREFPHRLVSVAQPSHETNVNTPDDYEHSIQTATPDEQSPG